MKKLMSNKFTFKNVFYSDRAMLLLSVIISFVLWFFLAVGDTEGKPVTISDIPINVNLSDAAVEDGLKVFGGQDTKAEVSVTGSRIIVGQLTKSDIQIVAQMASSITSPGNYTLELTPKKVGILTDYEFSSGVTPGFVTVMVDRYREAEFTVENGIQYNSDPAYFAGNTTFSTPVVKISGPESEISKVKRIVAETEITDVLKSSRTVYNVPLVMYDSYGEVISSDLINMSVTSEDVTIPVLLRKTLPISAKFINQPEDMSYLNNRITIDPTEIEIAGPEEMFNDYNAVELEPIDFSKIGSGNTEFEQSLIIPSGCKNLSNTYTVKVKIDMSGITSRRFNVTNFSIVNQSEGKQARVSTSSVLVTIVGPYSQISTMLASDIVGEINLNDKGNFTGHTEIPVKFKVNNYSYCWSYGEYSVNIEISDS